MAILENKMLWYIKNPWYIRRKIKFAYQRLTRGFSDMTLWNLSFDIEAYILPRLKAFKKMNRTGYPMRNNITPEQWEEILDKMIEAFELKALDGMCGDDEDVDLTMSPGKPTESGAARYDEVFNSGTGKTFMFNCDPDKQAQRDKYRKQCETKIEEGFKLFHEYFWDLWD